MCITVFFHWFLYFRVVRIWSLLHYPLQGVTFHQQSFQVGTVLSLGALVHFLAGWVSSLYVNDKIFATESWITAHRGPCPPVCLSIHMGAPSWHLLRRMSTTKSVKLGGYAAYLPVVFSMIHPRAFFLSPSYGWWPLTVGNMAPYTYWDSQAGDNLVIRPCSTQYLE